MSALCMTDLSSRHGSVYHSATRLRSHAVAGDAELAHHLASAAMSAAGYSGTPLPRKLGFKPGDTAAFLDAPGEIDELLEDLDGVTVKRSLRGRADVVLCFVTARR